TQRHVLNEGVRGKGLDYIVVHDQGRGRSRIVLLKDGRPLDGRRYNNGLQEAIEYAESLPHPDLEISKPTRTVDSMTIKEFIGDRDFAGMTGVVGETEAAFALHYNGKRVLYIEPHNGVQRNDLPAVDHPSRVAAREAVVADAKARFEADAAVLINAPDIMEAHLISQRLWEEGIPHSVLTGENIAREGSILANAGRRGAVTVSTVSGRGTDIKL